MTLKKTNVKLERASPTSRIQALRCRRQIHLDGFRGRRPLLETVHVEGPLDLLVLLVDGPLDALDDRAALEHLVHTGLLGRGRDLEQGRLGHEHRLRLAKQAASREQTNITTGFMESQQYYSK